MSTTLQDTLAAEYTKLATLVGGSPFSGRLVGGIARTLDNTAILVAGATLQCADQLTATAVDRITPIMGSILERIVQFEAAARDFIAALPADECLPHHTAMIEKQWVNSVSSVMGAICDAITPLDMLSTNRGMGLYPIVFALDANCAKLVEAVASMPNEFSAATDVVDVIRYAACSAALLRLLADKGCAPIAHTPFEGIERVQAACADAASDAMANIASFLVAIGVTRAPTNPALFPANWEPDTQAAKAEWIASTVETMNELCANLELIDVGLHADCL